jgi:hypothetical protein
VFKIVQTFFTNYYLYSERNNVAGISNQFLATSDDTLTELVNPSNNTEVAGFPKTSGHIRTMEAATLNEVLRRLGLGVGGKQGGKGATIKGIHRIENEPSITH